MRTTETMETMMVLVPECSTPNATHKDIKKGQAEEQQGVKVIRVVAVESMAMPVHYKEHWRKCWRRYIRWW